MAVVLTAGLGAAGPLAAGAPAPAAPTGPAAVGTVIAPGPGPAPRLDAPAEPTVRILDVSPRLPDARKITQVVRITVLVSNPTTQTFSGLSLRLRRGYPISSEATLEQAIAKPPPTDNVVLADQPGPSRLAPGESSTQVVPAAVGESGLCLCTPGPSVYPVDVVLGTAGTDVELARAHTFLPSFRSDDHNVKPVQVSWVWPLIDGPHRGTAASVFLDDDLAASVGPGGRLDRALRVAELVQHTVHLTLLVDPDLIDSLTAMSGGYTVRTTTGIRAGTGAGAATRWLARLRVLAEHVDVSITAYADPDVDALARMGVTVSTALDPQVGTRVRRVLGPSLSGPAGADDLAWPAGGTLSSAGLDQVIGNGASAVLLTDRWFSAFGGPGATPDAVSPLPSANGQATAFVLSSALKPSVASIMSAAARPADAQVLLAQLAVRAAQNPTASHYVVLAPARYVDPAPAVAASAMLAIAAAPWIQDLSIRAARLEVTPADRGTLRPDAPKGALGAKQIKALDSTRTQVAALRDCLANADAPALLGGFSAALARAGSSAWRGRAAAGQAYVAGLRTDIDKLSSEIRIVSPANASYTLASADAPLFVTVENRLDVPVRFRIKVSPATGELGFRTDPVAVQTIEAAAAGKPTRQQIKVQTHVARSGRFRIMVTLLSPSGEPLNKALPLRVRSTALGRAALWITGIAFGVLVAALGIRGVRRLRHRHRRRAAVRARARTAT